MRNNFPKRGTTISLKLIMIPIKFIKWCNRQWCIIKTREFCNNHTKKCRKNIATEWQRLLCHVRFVITFQIHKTSTLLALKKLALGKISGLSFHFSLIFMNEFRVLLAATQISRLRTGGQVGRYSCAPKKTAWVKLMIIVLPNNGNLRPPNNFYSWKNYRSNIQLGLSQKSLSFMVNFSILFIAIKFNLFNYPSK